MHSTFKILFYIKKNAIKSNGKAPIMARITLNGEISQFSVKCEINPAEWNLKAGKANGRSANAIKLNGLLDILYWVLPVRVSHTPLLISI